MNKDNKGKADLPSGDNQLGSDQRRKAVKNILAGSGLAVGAATSSSWVAPVVNSVVTPAHAQTSSPVVGTVLSGNASLSPVVGAPVIQNNEANSVLDFFIGTANAGASSGDLSGACLTLTIESLTTFSLVLEFFSYPNLIINGTISGSTLSGSGGGITIAGSIDASSASGTVSDGSSMFAFALDSSAGSCTPIEPTTAAPTTSAPTTMSPTTPSPTTPSPTTPSPTTPSPTTPSPTTPSPTTPFPTTSPPTTPLPTTPPFPTTPPPPPTTPAPPPT